MKNEFFQRKVTKYLPGDTWASSLSLLSLTGSFSRDNRARFSAGSSDASDDSVANPPPLTLLLKF